MLKVSEDVLGDMYLNFLTSTHARTFTILHKCDYVICIVLIPVQSFLSELGPPSLSPTPANHDDNLGWVPPTSSSMLMRVGARTRVRGGVAKGGGPSYRRGNFTSSFRHFACPH